jgi:hypothetical protein
MEAQMIHTMQKCGCVERIIAYFEEKKFYSVESLGLFHDHSQSALNNGRELLRFVRTEVPAFDDNNDNLVSLEKLAFMFDI